MAEYEFGDALNIDVNETLKNFAVASNWLDRSPGWISITWIFFDGAKPSTGRRHCVGCLEYVAPMILLR